MKAGSPRIEYAHAIEWRDAKFVFPRNRLSCGANRDCKAPARRWAFMVTNIVKNVLGSPDAGRPFQDANETRFAGTILSEDDCHAWGEIDLCARLERIDAVPNLQRIHPDGFE